MEEKGIPTESSVDYRLKGLWIFCGWRGTGLRDTYSEKYVTTCQETGNIYHSVLQVSRISHGIHRHNVTMNI